ncbi:hypothetical protein ACJ41O_004383 [Fusarium nematophilum]
MKNPIKHLIEPLQERYGWDLSEDLDYHNPPDDRGQTASTMITHLSHRVVQLDDTVKGFSAELEALKKDNRELRKENKDLRKALSLLKPCKHSDRVQKRTGRAGKKRRSVKKEAVEDDADDESNETDEEEDFGVPFDDSDNESFEKPAVRNLDHPKINYWGNVE